MAGAEHPMESDCYFRGATWPAEKWNRRPTSPPDPEYIPSKPGLEAPQLFTRTVCPECNNREFCLGELSCNHCSGGHTYTAVGAAAMLAKVLGVEENRITRVDAKTVTVSEKAPAEDAAPLDAQDGGLKTAMIHLFNLQSGLCQKHCGEGANRGYHLDGCRTLVNDLDLVDTRLSSLRESVASLTTQRDEAAFECAHFRLDSIELDRVKVERDAARKALEAVAAWHVSTPMAPPVDVALLVSAALSPTPSPKEAQNG